MNFQNKNVCVTGGAGFIGSTLSRELLKEKANVVVFDNFLIGTRNNLDDIKESIKIVDGDIRDDTFKKFLIDNSIDYVFNLAAEPYIPHCYDRPTQFFEINANGALNVMLASKEAGVKRVMQYSTSEVYGTSKFSPMDEHHPLDPLSTYAVSKLAADRLCFTMFKEHKIPIITLRQFNCYGPRETQPYVIAEIVSQLTKSNKVNLGNIHARRDFTYVVDAAKASIELMKHKEAEGQIFNSGFGKDYSIEDLANRVGKIIGHKEIKIIIDKNRLRPIDVQKLECNYFKLHKLTGWEPTVDIEEGLEKTINWFNAHDNKWTWEENTKFSNVWKQK